MPPAINSAAYKHDRPLYALLLRAGAMIALSIMFACVKYLSEHSVHLVESLFFRQFCALPVVFFILVRGSGLKGIHTQHFSKHASRTLVGMCGMVCYFTSITMLPLAEATTIGFSVPIFATILSAIFLKEYVGIHRWSAVIIGFIGVVIITQPSGGAHADINITGAMIALAAAFIASIVSLLLRQLGRTETPTSILFWFSSLSLIPLGLLMPFFIQPHTPFIWAVLIFMGTVGGVAQWLLTAALRSGPVSLVLSVDYTSLMWSTMLGWFIWADLPSEYTWAGALLICGSGLYIIWREHQRLREARMHQPPLAS